MASSSAMSHRNPSKRSRYHAGAADTSQDVQLGMGGDAQSPARAEDPEAAEPAHQLGRRRTVKYRVSPYGVDGAELAGIDDGALLVVLEQSCCADAS